MSRLSRARAWLDADMRKPTPRWIMTPALALLAYVTVVALIGGIAQIGRDAAVDPDCVKEHAELARIVERYAPAMDGAHSPISDAELDKLFIKYATFPEAELKCPWTGP